MALDIRQILVETLKDSQAKQGADRQVTPIELRVKTKDPLVPPIGKTTASWFGTGTRRPEIRVPPPRQRSITTPYVTGPAAQQSGFATACTISMRPYEDDIIGLTNLMPASLAVFCSIILPLSSSLLVAPTCLLVVTFRVAQSKKTLALVRLEAE